MASKGALVIRFLGDTRDFNNSMRKVQGKAGKFGKLAKAGGALAAAGLVAAGAAAVKASKGFLEFDDAMNSSLAIMGDVSGPMRKEMEKAARAVGKTTRFSATEAAEAYFFLASAGMDAAQSVKAMPAVAKFAAAGNFDLATATDLATDAQSALGLAVKNPAKNLANLTRTTDVFVKANTLANTSVQQISEAMTNKAGAAMRALGMDIEEGSAVLAAFADQGTKGAEAGTQFSIVLRDLQTKALSNKDAFKKAGVSVFDANGEFRNMGSIMSDLEGHLDGMSDAQKKAALATLGFSDKSMGALTTLLGSSKAIKSYEKDLRKAGGTTADVAAKQLQSFSARIDIMKSKVTDVGLTVGGFLVKSLFTMGDAFKSGEVKGKGLTRFLTTLGAGLKDVVGFVKSKVAPIFAGGLGGSKMVGELAKTGGAVASFAKSLLPPLKEFGSKLKAVLGPGLKEIGALLQKELLPAFRKFLPVVQPVAKFLIKVLGGAVIGALKGAIQAIKGVVNVIAGVFKLVSALVNGEWGKAWAALKQIASGAMNALVGAIKVFWNISILGIFRKGAIFLTKGIWLKLWAGLKSLGAKGWAGLGKMFAKGAKGLGKLLLKGVKLYGKLWLGLFRLLLKLTRTGLSKILGFFKSLPGRIVGGLRRLNSLVAGVFRKAMSSGFSVVKGIGGQIRSWIAGIPGKIAALGGRFAAAGKGLLQKFIDGMKNAAGIITGIAGNVWNAVRGLLNGAISKINDALNFEIPVPGPNIKVNAGKIPHLAKGGIVTRPTLAVVGEAGPEAVVPLGRGGGVGGGMQVVINVSGAKDPKAVAREIHRELVKLKRNLGRDLGLA